MSTGKMPAIFNSMAPLREFVLASEDVYEKRVSGGGSSGNNEGVWMSGVKQAILRRELFCYVKPCSNNYYV